MDKKLLSVAWYSYKKKIMSWQFVLIHALIFIIPLIIGVIIAFIALSQNNYINEKQVAVIMETGTTRDYVKLFNEVNDNSDSLYIKYDGTLESIEKEIINEKYHGVVIVKETVVNEIHNLPNYEFVTYDLTNIQIKQIVTDDFENVTENIVFEENNIDRTYFENYEFRQLKESGATESELALMSGIVIVIVALLAIITAPSISIIGQDIIYEKTDRVMELILSSISSTKLFISKILVGVFLTLTELLIIASVLGIALLLGVVSAINNSDVGSFSNIGDILSNINIPIVISLGTLFVLGYFMFNLIISIVFSSFATDQETGGLWAMIPAVFMMIVLYVNIFLNMNPNTPITRTLSFIPPFSGMVMPMRLIIFGNDIPIWEPIVSLMILLIVVALIAYFGNKIFAKTSLYYNASKKKGKFHNFIKMFSKKK